jgi:hypothetical protein
MSLITYLLVLAVQGLIFGALARLAPTRGATR